MGVINPDIILTFPSRRFILATFCNKKDGYEVLVMGIANEHFLIREQILK
jgi:hypothetical protein